MSPLQVRKGSGKVFSTGEHALLQTTLWTYFRMVIFPLLLSETRGNSLLLFFLTMITW